MDTVPLNAAGLPIDFEPEYCPVKQSVGMDNDCIFAVFSTLTGRSVEQMRGIAVAHGYIPANGCFNPIDDGSLAALLAGQNGWVASVWKECSHTYEIKSDVAILLVDVTDKFPGRHVLFCRQRNHGGQPNVEHIIDPGYWIPPERQIRAISDHELSWYIALHQMDTDSDY